MAEFPALPLWTDAYIGDTAHLTNEEHGVYMRLLMFAWRSPECCLPDDDKRLAIMVGMTDKKWRAIKPVIAAFWTIENGVWTQKRLTKERDFVRGKSRKNRDAALARWNDKPLKENNEANADASPGHMPERCQTDAPTPTPIKKERDTNVSLSPSAPKPKRKTRIPPDAVISEKQIQIAKGQGHTEAEARAQFERFKDGAIANGRAYVDWDAAWRNWFTSQYFKPITYAGNGDAYGNGNRNNGFAAGGRPGYGSGIDTMLRGFQSAADRRSGGIGGDFGSD